MKSGFVSILGRPNVGKSSLLNQITGFPVAITSSTIQTTRNLIKGIYNDRDAQIVFVDTPGIHKPKQQLGNLLNKKAYSTIKDVDYVLFLTPINESLGAGDKFIIDKIGNLPRAAVITKLDLADSQIAKIKADELKELGFNIILGVSVNMPRSVTSLIALLKKVLPEGTPFYDLSSITDVSTRFIVKELIREAILSFVKDEIPHAVGVEIKNFEEQPRYVEITAIIHVAKDSQKGIIIGKGGKMIKQIGIYARKNIKQQLGMKNILHLQVKVSKNWTKNQQMIKKLA